MPRAKDRPTASPLVFLLPALCAIAFGWSTLDAPFQPGDDHSLILANPLVRNFSLAAAAELASSLHSDLYQPLPMLSFQANFAAAGDSPRSYHVVNILLHVACTLLASMLAWRISRDPPIVCLTGVLFAIHPLAMDAVGWISGRILLMAALFALVMLNLVAWRSDKPGPGWSLATLLAGVGMLLSKVIPGVPLAAAWLDGATHPPKGTLRERPRPWWGVMATLVVFTVAMTVLSARTERSAAMAEAAESVGVPAGVRMLLAVRYYLENYAAPTRLTVWSPIPRDATWTSPGVLIGAFEALALILLAWAARRGAPLITVGIGLFGLLLLPFLLAVGVRNFLTADRYMYLPMAGLHLATAAMLVGIWRFVPRPSLRVVMGSALVAALVFLFIVGRGEAEMRRDIVAVARRAMDLNPDDVRIPVKLAKIYNETRRTDDAMATITEARHRWPDDPGLAGEAGVALRMMGDFPSAEAEFRRAVTGQPDDLRAKYYLALTLEDLEQTDAAAALYREILAVRHDYVPASTALARNLLRAGKQTEALAAFDQALRTNPRHRGALSNATQILLDLERPDEAMNLATRLLEQNPMDSDARLLSARCLAALARYDEAETTLRNVLPVAPGRRAVLLQLHDVLLASRRFEAAVELWQDAARAEPANTEWAARRDWAEALRQLARAVKRPGPSAEQPDAQPLAKFAECVRRGHAESPAHLIPLTSTPPPRSSVDDEQLARIIEDLGRVAAVRPNEPVLYYATSVALALRGNERLAQLMRDQLPAATLPPEWARPLAALDDLIADRAASTRPALPE